MHHCSKDKPTATLLSTAGKKNTVRRKFVVRILLFRNTASTMPRITFNTVVTAAKINEFLIAMFVPLSERNIDIIA